MRKRKGKRKLVFLSCVHTAPVATILRRSIASDLQRFVGKIATRMRARRNVVVERCEGGPNCAHPLQMLARRREVFPLRECLRINNIEIDDCKGRTAELHFYGCCHLTSGLIYRKPSVLAWNIRKACQRMAAM